MFYPAYHIDNFKPWIPSHTKSLKSSSPEPSISSSLKSHIKSHKPRSCLSTNPLPIPRTQAHPLPARPPVEVCVHTSTNTRSNIPSASQQTQPQETSKPSLSTPSTEDFRHRLTSPLGPANDSSNLDPSSTRGIQDNADASIELPFFREVARDSPSSPDTSSSDESLDESFKLPDVQSDIPIDPIILGEDGFWEAGDLHEVVHQENGDSTSETFCSYPEPPSIPCSASNYHEAISEQPDHQHVAQANSPLQGRVHQLLHPSEQSTEPDAPYTNDPEKNVQNGNQSQNCKRKAQRSEEQTRKRRAPTSLAKGQSFTALCAHFTSLPLDERLQFLSWLFESALSRCLLDSMSTTCEDENKQSASHSTVSHKIAQTRRNCSKVHRGSRKGKPWSDEEEDLLLKLRKDEGRPWSEVTRLFSDRYPGRSQGSIQVYWSTTLNHRG